MDLEYAHLYSLDELVRRNIERSHQAGERDDWDTDKHININMTNVQLLEAISNALDNLLQIRR